MGFTNAVKLVMRLRPGGLLWMATVCSSFVFANSSNTHRNLNNPEARHCNSMNIMQRCQQPRTTIQLYLDGQGDETYEPVAQGNLMAKIAAWLMVLATSRGVKAQCARVL